MNVIDEIKKDAAGLELINDWLGDGGVPVKKELAESRALICETCPENRPGKIWEVIKHMAAMWIRREMEIKHTLDLKLSNEDNVGMCRACGCCNRLKVWTPLRHINEHTSKEVFDRFPKHCWIIKEQS